MLNKGRHLYTNEFIIPEEVVDHVAYGRSISHGEPQFSTSKHARKSYMSFLMFLIN